MNRLTRLPILVGLAFLALLLTGGSVPAPQEGGIVVGGRVTNGTRGGSVPADLSVTLHVFSGLEETGAYDTAVAADGSFRLDGLSLGEGDTVVARVVYRRVTYLSDVVTIGPGQQALSLPVVIYETTGDPAAIVVAQLHVLLTRVEDRLQVGEYYLVSNAGDRTYVGVEDQGADRRATLTFTLPDGAAGLGFDGPGLGERFLERGGGFADTRPVPPGTATVEVLFHYRLPYREGLRVERVFDVPVDAVALLLPEGDVVLEGERITRAGTLDTEMGPALSYTAGPLAAGEPLVLTLAAGPQLAPATPTGAAPSRNAPVELALGLLALAAGAVAAYLLARYPAVRPLPAGARPLVEGIAALDVRFEAGEVPEGAYRQRRASLKMQVHALVNGSGGAERQGSGGATDRSND
jgi:hypothetical protein